jgi:hypothetical protein
VLAEAVVVELELMVIPHQPQVEQVLLVAYYYT